MAIGYPLSPHTTDSEGLQAAHPNVRKPDVWTRWIPPKGRVRWSYAALISVLLIVLIVAPIAVNEQLKKTKKDLTEASKPLLTQSYTTLTFPANTSRLFRDPYNTTGIYKVYPGDDRRGNNIFATLEYTIEACLLACNKYNEFHGGRNGSCAGGTMNFNQEESTSGQTGANCFLKWELGSDIDGTNPMALGFRLCKGGNCTVNSG